MSYCIHSDEHLPITSSRESASSHQGARLHRLWRMTVPVAFTLMSVSGCGGDPVAISVPFIPPEEVFWALTMNHRAVNLSMTDPYDTLTLRATPRNIAGVPLPDIPTATFRAGTPSDTSVIVYADGRIEGRKRTTATTGLRVIATLTYNGVTRSDTTFVTVTPTAPAPTPRLAEFRFQLPEGDSSRIAAAGYLDTQNKRLSDALVARDSSNAIISRLNVFYESSNPIVATINRNTGVLTALLPGSVTIRATAMAYGISKTDSIRITVTDMLVTFLQLGAARIDAKTGAYISDAKVFSNRITYLTPGGNVLWSNLETDSVDIVFDNPDAVLKGTGTQGLLYGDTGGNMAPFGVSIEELRNFVDQPGIRIRSFPTRGTYRWHSTRRAVSGTIIVR